jgi:hypothetical protein
MKTMMGWAIASVTSAMMLGGCAVNVEDDGASTAKVDELRADCALVRCALPMCSDGQRLSYEGGCCPRCVGAPSKCATVMCAAIACAEGEQLVTSPGDCCGRCAKAPKVAECNTDSDCPQLYCFACPCPVSTCSGRKCVTSTPDASTCGAN